MIATTKLDWTEKEIVGEGYNLKDKNKQFKDIIIPEENRTGHFWCFGTTRVGKTRIMENMIEQDIRKGYSVTVIDPKSDIELFSKIVQIAAEENRLEDLIFITPIFPEYSAILDPLAYYYMPEELVGHITSGVETGGNDQFFFNVAYETSLAIVLSLLMEAKHKGIKPKLNLLDVKNLISPEQIKKIKEERIDPIAGTGDPEAMQLSNDLSKILESPPDFFSKISSSLRVVLTELTSGNIGKIIGTADENRFIKRLQEGKKVILVAHLGSLMTRKAAFVVGKILLSMIQSLAGRTLASGGKITPPMPVYIDEAQNVLYPDIDALLAMAGGAGIWMHGFCQGVSQLYSALGEDKARVILDNTNTKIFMRVTDYETAKFAASHFGQKKVYSPILNMHGELQTREVDIDAVTPDDIMKMNKREFYMITYTGDYRGTSKTVSPLYVDVKFPIVKPTDYVDLPDELTNTESIISTQDLNTKNNLDQQIKK
jgi:hypothetical protein